MKKLLITLLLTVLFTGFFSFNCSAKTSVWKGKLGRANVRFLINEDTGQFKIKYKGEKGTFMKGKFYPTCSNGFTYGMAHLTSNPKTKGALEVKLGENILTGIMIIPAVCAKFEIDVTWVETRE